MPQVSSSTRTFKWCSPVFEKKHNQRANRPTPSLRQRIRATRTQSRRSTTSSVPNASASSTSNDPNHYTLDLLSFQRVMSLQVELVHSRKLNERRLRVVEATSRGMEDLVRGRQQATEARDREVGGKLHNPREGDSCRTGCFRSEFCALEKPTERERKRALRLVICLKFSTIGSTLIGVEQNAQRTK